jgi:rubrerythrin
VHALAHFRVAGQVKDTISNLKTAIEGERYEFTEMYPAFIADAIAEGQKGAQSSFERANQVERTHYALYSQALEAAQSGKDLPAADMYICEVCGHTVMGEPPDVCPVCGARHDKFTRIE